MSARLIHPFEHAGLGLAPFRCVGVHERKLPSGQPCGMCQFCGTGILYCFRIRSADGKEFIVGSDCVLRTGTAVDDKGLTVEVRRVIADQRRAKADARRDAMHQRARAARALLTENPSLMADQPHPSDYFAGQGLRLRDYYDYLLKTTYGEASLRRYCQIVEQAHASSADVKAAS